MGRHQTVQQGHRQQTQRDRSQEHWQRQRSSNSGVQLPLSSAKTRSTAIEPSRLSKSEPRLSAQRPLKLLVQILVSLICRPMSLVLLVWLLSVITAGVATFYMLTVDPSYEPTPEQSLTPPIPREADSLSQGQEPSSLDIQRSNHSRAKATARKQTSPLFSLGIAVFSCVMGSLLISRCFRSRSTANEQTRLPSIPQRLPRNSSTFREPTAQEPNNLAVSPEIQRSESNSEQAVDRPVIVVSDQEHHPLDWDEPSLADHLDLRQKRPLSYWL